QMENYWEGLSALLQSQLGISPEQARMELDELRSMEGAGDPSDQADGSDADLDEAPSDDDEPSSARATGNRRLR
ncbi:MAG: hypothetical protein ACYC2K_14510, partial [Gemmatimonadales bacterium]